LRVFEELSVVRARGTSAKVHLALKAPIETRGRPGRLRNRYNQPPALDRRATARDAELTNSQGIALGLRNFFHNDEGRITTAFPRHSWSSA